MDIHGKQGKIRSASLGEVHVRIKDLAAPDLELDGSVYGSLPVMLAEDPLTAVALGTGRCLDELRLLREVTIQS